MHFSFCQIVLVVPTVLLHLLANSENVTELRIISILPYSTPIIPALIWTGAALQVAMEQANELYAGYLSVSAEFLYDLKYDTCELTAANSPWMLAEYFYKHARPGACHAVIAAGCGGFSEPAYLAKEWKIPLFINGMSRQDEVRSGKFSSFGFSGTYESLARVLLQLMLERQWFHATVLWDSNAASLFYHDLAFAFQKESKISVEAAFDVQLAVFDGTSERTMRSALKVAKARSRVILLACRGIIVKTALELAATLGMVSEEYAYLTFQPTQQKMYGPLELFTHASELELRAYSRLVYIMVHETDDTMGIINQRIKSKGLASYHTIYETDYPLDYYAVKSTYDAVMIWVQAVNESLSGSRGSFCTETTVQRAVANRTFVLDSGTTHVNSDGTRTLDVDVYSFDAWKISWQRSAVYKAASSKFVWENRQLLTTVLDIPQCGFSGSEGRCNQTESTSTKITAAVCLVVLLALLVALLVVRRWYHRLHPAHWWLIPDKDINLPGQHDLETERRAELRGSPVWIRTYSTKDTAAVIHEKLSHFPLLIQLAEIQHENVSRLFGFHLTQGQIQVVTAYEKQGTVRELFRRHHLERDVRLSFVSDFCEGLAYIHYSALKYHGALTPSCCLISGTFALKVAKADLKRILSHLHIIEDKPDDENSANRARTEAVKTEILRVSDVYQFGQISTDVILRKSMSVHSEDVLHELEQMLADCVDPVATERPSFDQLRKKIRRCVGSKRSFIQNYSDRLLRYADALESAVLSKTEELKQERRRCDEILHEMLPRSVVISLRSGTTAMAEFFDSVTVAFVDLPGFSKFILDILDMDSIVRLLNTVYSDFDAVLSGFAVQKIETVGDCYMVASGVPRIVTDHPVQICTMAMSLLNRAYELPLSNTILRPRAGIASGPCVAGVIGRKLPRYCLCGDTVNTASRMQSTGEPGKTQLAASTVNMLPENLAARCKSRGLVEIKGKSKMLTFWLLDSKAEQTPDTSSVQLLWTGSTTRLLVPFRPRSTTVTEAEPLLHA